jgi:hypothetical protein
MTKDPEKRRINNARAYQKRKGGQAQDQDDEDIMGGPSL